MNILEGIIMSKIKEIEQELLLKEKRVSYWEKHHEIPKISDLENSIWG